MHELATSRNGASELAYEKKRAAPRTICLTTSDGLCKSINRLWMRSW